MVKDRNTKIMVKGEVLATKVGWETGEILEILVEIDTRGYW